MLRSSALILIAALVLPTLSAQAMDRRVARPASVLLKTTGIGIGGGILVGAAGAAIFGIGVRGLFKCASLGLYGGLGFGLFVLLAPAEMIYGTPEEEFRGRRSGDEGESAALPSHFKPVAQTAWAPLLTTRF